MRGQVPDSGIAAGVRGLAALFVAILPARCWGRHEELPVAAMVIPSAIFTGLVGAALQIWNFFHYAARVSASATPAVMKVAEQQSRYEPTGVAQIGMPSFQAFTMPSVFAACLFTPLGLLGTYLFVSAVVRAASAIVGDPLGDPLMTFVDATWRGRVRRLRQDREARDREAAEGPDVPDRIATGAAMSMPGVDVVVIASRRKPEWTAGVLVLTPGAWYRLGEPFDLYLPEGLRVAYPLTMLQTGEVVRRGVRYEFPPSVG